MIEQERLTLPVAIFLRSEYKKVMATALTPTTFWILTALADGRRHGYDILSDVAEASEGAVALKVPTLYAALERMERDGLVARDGDDVINGRARRYFRLTDYGRTRLTAEVESLEKSAAVARRRMAASVRVTPRLAFRGVLQGRPA